MEMQKTLEAQHREFFEAQLEQQRQRAFAARLEAQRRAAQEAQQQHQQPPQPPQQEPTSSHQPCEPDAPMKVADPLTAQDPWSKDKQNERVLKERKSEVEDTAYDPTKQTGGDYWTNMRLLLAHNSAHLEQSLDNMTQTTMNELGSRIEGARDSPKAATDSLERRIETIAAQVDKNKQALESGAHAPQPGASAEAPAHWRADHILVGG